MLSFLFCIYLKSLIFFLFLATVTLTLDPTGTPPKNGQKLTWYERALPTGTGPSIVCTNAVGWDTIYEIGQSLSCCSLVISSGWTEMRLKLHNAIYINTQKFSLQHYLKPSLKSLRNYLILFSPEISKYERIMITNNSIFIMFVMSLSKIKTVSILLMGSKAWQAKTLHYWTYTCCQWIWKLLASFRVSRRP